MLSKYSIIYYLGVILALTAFKAIKAERQSKVGTLPVKAAIVTTNCIANMKRKYSDLTPEQVADWRVLRYDSNPPAANCFMKCLYKHLQLLKDDGSLDSSKYTEDIPVVPSGDVEKCNSEAASTSDKCEKTMKVHQCLLASHKEDIVEAVFGNKETLESPDELRNKFLKVLKLRWDHIYL